MRVANELIEKSKKTPATVFGFIEGFQYGILALIFTELAIEAIREED